MIRLYFDKLYGKDRIAQPCLVSIPFAKGVLSEKDAVCIVQGENTLPLQKKILSCYPDGSVKYLLLRFLANIPANKDAETICLVGTECRETEECPQTQLMYRKTEFGYEVSNGKLDFSVKENTMCLLDWLQNGPVRYEKESSVGPSIKRAGNPDMVCLNYGTWRVIEAGPVCVILSNQGKFTEELLCETRVTVYAGTSWVDVEQRLLNASEQVFDLSAWEFSWKGMQFGGNVRTCVAESNYKTSFEVSEEGGPVEKNITAEFLLNQSNEHFGEVFHGTFFADCTGEQGGVCATIYQAHQNFPKAIKAESTGITLKLVPEGCESVKLQPGMAIKQQFRLDFHAKEDLQEINHRSIQYQMPDYPLLEPCVYEQSGLFPDIFVQNDMQDGEVEAALLAAADIHTRSYGMLNWGDAPDPNYTAQGRGQGKLVWTNNEYDYPHACMLQFVRTGIRRFLDYCIVSGTHQRDVDICHYSKNELLRGGQWEHTKGHSVDGVIVCSHEWVEGLLDCYHITGDERFLSAAIGIGENVLRLLDTPTYQKTGGLNARETGWALRTLTALYKENYEEKWLAKSDWIVSQFKEWGELYGGWLAPYTDNTQIRVPFMISVAVGSLMRYYREFPREDIRTMILSAVDDMIRNCYMKNGYFIYKELPSLARVGNNPLVLEALTIAYELTGNAQYLFYGKKTFDAVIAGSQGSYGANKRITEDTVLAGNTGTKRFAQMFVPVVTYYKAVMAAEKEE